MVWEARQFSVRSGILISPKLSRRTRTIEAAPNGALPSGGKWKVAQRAGRGKTVKGYARGAFGRGGGLCFGAVAGRGVVFAKKQWKFQLRETGVPPN